MVVGVVAAGGAAVDDERNAVADLVADAGGVGALGRALQIGGGGGDGQAESLDDGAGNGGIGNADGHIAGVGGGTQRQLGAGADDDGERSGPEVVGELVEHGIGVARQFVGLRQARDEQRERLVLLAALELVDVLDGVKIYGVDRQAVEGVGGQRDDIALAQARDDVVDPVWLGLVGMDAQNFRGQEGLPRFSRGASAVNWHPVIGCSPCWPEI